MLTVFRHLISVLLLPFVAAVVMPAWLLTEQSGLDSRWVNNSSSIVRLFRCTGATVVTGGFALFIWCVILFACIGKGTLVPWDPTRNLVAIGPYRLIRNPMISAVALMLIGEAIVRGSWILCVWACSFIVINHMYFVLSEEPGLEKRFGEQYRFYKENVPRWIPRFRSKV